MAGKDPLRGGEYSIEVVKTEEGLRLPMTCKCGWVKLLKINTGTGTGLRVAWHVNCQEVLANHSEWRRNQDRFQKYSNH